MIKWVIQLSEFRINLGPRATIKCQASVDFITEFIGQEETPLESQEK